MKAIIKVGYSCNNNCIFCHSIPKRTNKDLSLSAIKKKISRIKEKMVKTIVLSGGEPSIRKDFFDIADFIREEGLSLGLNTNGRLLSDDSFFDKLISYKPTFILISLHGATKGTHDSITKVPGSFKQTYEAMKRLSNIGAEKIVNFVINKKNIKEIEKFIGLAGSLNFRIKFSFLEPVDDHNIVPKMNDIANKLKKIIDKHRNCVKIWVDGFPLCSIKGYFEYINNLKTNDIIYISESYEKDFHKSDKGNKIKLKKCKTCAVNAKCEGIYSKYLELYGENEFNPIY